MALSSTTVTLSTDFTTVAQSDVLSQVLVTAAKATNLDTVAHRVTLNFVPSGNDPIDGTVISQTIVPAGKTVSVSIAAQSLYEGAFFAANSDANGLVNLMVSVSTSV